MIVLSSTAERTRKEIEYAAHNPTYFPEIQDVIDLLNELEIYHTFAYNKIIIPEIKASLMSNDPYSHAPKLFKLISNKILGY